MQEHDFPDLLNSGDGHAVPGGMKTIGIQIASAILSGDVSRARSLADGMRSVSVAEGRAISRACEVANARWGCSLTLTEFLASSV